MKALNVGSSGGVAAARRGECDLAGVHLLDPATGLYNRHLLAPGGLELVPAIGGCRASCTASAIRASPRRPAPTWPWPRPSPTRTA